MRVPGENDGDFHTITSILKLINGYATRGLVEQFPYDYVYFKATCHTCHTHHVSQFPYDYVYFKARRGGSLSP